MQKCLSFAPSATLFIKHDYLGYFRARVVEDYGGPETRALILRILQYRPYISYLGDLYWEGDRIKLKKAECTIINRKLTEEEERGDRLFIAALAAKRPKLDLKPSWRIRPYLLAIEYDCVKYYRNMYREQRKRWYNLITGDPQLTNTRRYWCYHNPRVRIKKRCKKCLIRHACKPGKFPDSIRVIR